MQDIELIQKLKDQRMKSGITQKEFAKILGAGGQDTIALWEMGRFHPSRKFMRKILDFLAMEPAALRVYKQSVTKRETVPNKTE